jgi:hypothetical protein
MGESHFAQKVSEKSGFAILEDRKNTLIKHIHRPTYAEADLKPFLTILGTAMRTILSIGLLMHRRTRLQVY